LAARLMPMKLKAIVRTELANYGSVNIVAATVRRCASYNRHRYNIEDSRGRLTRARIVILAVGLVAEELHTSTWPGPAR
jgi:hypothetical protein